MYTMENYFWGVVAYVIGVLLTTPLLWWVTGSIPWHPVKAFFRILMLAVLLTPAYPYEGMVYIAPAWIVGVFEVVKSQTGEGIWRGLIPIGFCFVVVYIVDLCLWRLLLGRSKRRQAEQVEDEAAGDRQAASQQHRPEMINS